MRGPGGLALLLLAPSLVAAQAEPRDVPLGVTELLEDPACTVGYQRFGEPEQILGWRWTGYDPESGVYFVPEQPEGERYPVFLHCPWAQGPGVTFAEFRLRLPAVETIRLEVSTRLRETAPGSDGITYRVRVDGQVVWEETGGWKRWRDAACDLAAYAGREVALRLEVDPGPARDTRDDWSLWGKATLIVGTAEQVAAANAERARERAEQRRRELLAGAERAERDLASFGRADVTSARPSTAGPVQVSAGLAEAVATFTCAAGDETILYRLDAAKGLLDGLTVEVDGRPLDPPPFAGGPQLLVPPGAKAPEPALLECRLADDRLHLVYEYRRPEAEFVGRLAAEVWAEGKSLGLSLTGDAGKIGGFAVDFRGATIVPTPLCAGPEPRRHRSGVYIAALADLFGSDATSVSGAGAARTAYLPLTDGRRRPLRDRFWLTVSRDYFETLPNLPHAPSPFLADLAHRAVLDGWGGAFADDQRWLDEMARYGVNSLLFIKHVWQRDGYDQTYPNWFPANAEQGGDAALRSLCQRAREIGHRFCVHENFYDYYPNAEAYHVEHCALDGAGKFQLGWDNGKVVAHILKPSLLMDYARRFSPEIVSRYGCNAAYHDIMPTWRVDFDAGAPLCGSIRETHQVTRALCDYDRELFGGPVVFEAADPLLAGIYDGGCNHGGQSQRTLAQPAFELLKVHPKMSHHGWNYYERWLPWGYGDGWYSYLMTDRELDHYRAQEIAFGRTGFLGHQLMPYPHPLVREYHLMQAFARAYTGRALRQLAFFVEEDGWSGWIDAATAARYQLCDRLRAVYDDGQEVYVNFSDRVWEVADVSLPVHGAYTRGPRATAGTILRDGQISDYAEYDGTRFADARSHIYAPPAYPDAVTPRAVGFRDRGDGSFELAVEWQVERVPERDAVIFWHFTNARGIQFQRDHAAPKPTTTWQVGEVVTDGPLTIAVPAEQVDQDYDFVVGLYDPQGRLPLAYGATSLTIGSLSVDREDGRVTAIRFAPREPGARPGVRPEPYREGANLARRVIDFGPLATDGAVVARTRQDLREVVPVPIGETIRCGLADDVGEARAFGRDDQDLGPLPLERRDGKTWFTIPAAAARVVVR